MAHRLSESDVSPAIARKIAARASGADEAVVVGTRAGVIEWANAAWGKVTGYAVDDAIDKPIGWLLDAADIEAPVVDFVQRHFLTGRRCEVEFPVVTPDGRHLWIHLDVEPFRDEQGEVSDFVAVATDITARRRGELALEDRIAQALADSADEAARPANEIGERDDDLTPSSHRRGPDAPTLEAMMTLARVVETAEAAARRYATTDPSEAIAEAGDLARQQLARFASGAVSPAVREVVAGGVIDLGETLRSLCVALAPQLPSTVAIDAEIGLDATPLRVDGEALQTLIGELMSDAARAIGDEWGTLSITTGRTEAGQALPSPVHPSIDRLPLGENERLLYVELHDTAASLSRDSLGFIHDSTGTPSTDSRSLGLVLARVRAQRLGATLRVHSLPGVGTRVLVYFPA